MLHELGKINWQNFMEVDVERLLEEIGMKESGETYSSVPTGGEEELGDVISNVDEEMSGAQDNSGFQDSGMVGTDKAEMSGFFDGHVKEEVVEGDVMEHTAFRDSDMELTMDYESSGDNADRDVPFEWRYFAAYR